MDILVALIAASAALGGSAIGAYASRTSAVSAADVSERIARANRVQEIRRTAARAYSESRTAVEWLHGHRVEDSALPEFEEIEAEYLSRSEILRRARDSLSEVAALAPPSLSQPAECCAFELGRLDEAWKEGRSAARHYHSRSEGSVPPAEWFGERLVIRTKVIDEVRDLLLGPPVESGLVLSDVVSRSPGLLDELRSAIADFETTT